MNANEWENTADCWIFHLCHLALHSTSVFSQKITVPSMRLVVKNNTIRNTIIYFWNFRFYLDLLPKWILSQDSKCVFFHLSLCFTGGRVGLFSSTVCLQQILLCFYLISFCFIEFILIYLMFFLQLRSHPWELPCFRHSVPMFSCKIFLWDNNSSLF